MKLTTKKLYDFSFIFAHTVFISCISCISRIVNSKSIDRLLDIDRKLRNARKSRRVQCQTGDSKTTSLSLSSLSAPTIDISHMIASSVTG